MCVHVHQEHYIFVAIKIRIVNRAIIADNNDEIVRGSRYTRYISPAGYKSRTDTDIGTSIANEILPQEQNRGSHFIIASL